MEEWKEALEAAVNKTIGAWNKASEAFFTIRKVLNTGTTNLIDMWKLFHMRSEFRKKILSLTWKKKDCIEQKRKVNEYV